MKKNFLTCPILPFLTFLLPVCAFAQSNNEDIKVTLSLNETGDNCVWGGGTEGNGDVVVQAKTGAKKIQVKLEGKDGEMRFGGFYGEGADQMKATGGGKTINIFNANTGAADVKYDILTSTVINGKTLTVACEPKVINKT